MNLPGSKVRVSSWSELIAELHSRQLLQFCPEEGDHLRSPYVFRGVDVANWGLLTSLQRIPRNTNASTGIIECSLIRSFRKYANAGAFDDKSEWYVLAVAQHNGLPTRCLDWTSSPLVATHFACGDEAYKNDDGAIWCLHVYDTLLLENSFTNLAGLDKSFSDGTIMLLWEPPSLDARIANQTGLLSIMNSADESQNDFLQTYSSHFQDLVIRIVIDAAAKPEVRDILDQNNISERTLFPGLPGLCDWLKRYYGKAW